MANVMHILTFKCLILTTATGLTYTIFHKYSLIPPNVRYEDFSIRHKDKSTMECVALCDGADSCWSVNYNLKNKWCELTPHVPRVSPPKSISYTQWRVYFRDPLIPAASAWQSSTHADEQGPFLASYAIDGNRDNNDRATNKVGKCAHTSEGYNYWAMEFRHTATVDHVIIYFRNNDQTNQRNEDLQLLVSMTRDDIDNDIGDECATYPGPSTTALPVTIVCKQPITGNFLKIKQNKDTYLTLCEVEVYSN